MGADGVKVQVLLSEQVVCPESRFGSLLGQSGLLWHTHTKTHMQPRAQLIYIQECACTHHPAWLDVAVL
jgi:hypothetical protein